MIVYGRHPVVEYITQGKEVEKVLVMKNIERDFLQKVQKLCKEKGIPLQLVPKEKLNRTTQHIHQGIIATIPLIHYQSLENVIPYLFEQKKIPLILILDSITDVRNFGSIARSAECMGVDAIIIADQGAAPVNDVSMKTSAGALSRIHVCKVKKMAEAIAFLQNNGIMVYASSLQSSKRLDEIDWTLPSAIILGSEDNGVQKYLVKSADESFIIPQVGTTDSLNVSVANGVILYEAQRQRLMNGSN